MIKAIVTDFSRVLLFPTDKNYTGKLNPLHNELLKNGDYDFWKYFELNTELLHFFRELSKSMKVFMVTNEYIQDYPPVREKIKGVFENIFIAMDLHVKKTEPQAYLVLAKELKLRPDEMLFIDDSIENISAAKNAGLKTIIYQNNPQTIERIGQEIMDSVNLDL